MAAGAGVTTFNAEQAIANHTANNNKISQLVQVIERRNKRIKDLSGMVSYLQNRVAELEAANSLQAQAERHFK